MKQTIQLSKIYSDAVLHPVAVSRRAELLVHLRLFRRGRRFAGPMGGLFEGFGPLGRAFGHAGEMRMAGRGFNR